MIAKRGIFDHRLGYSENLRPGAMPGRIGSATTQYIRNWSTRQRSTLPKLS